MPFINKDTRVCISLSSNPSNLGTRFHNFLYRELDLDFVYKAFSTTDLEGAVRGIRALNLRGCSVSMPFKEAIMSFVDELLPSAEAIRSVNTVVNENGRLLASNTDFEAVASLLKSSGISPDLSVLVRGSGGMAKAVVGALKAAGFADVTIVARNQETGLALAKNQRCTFLSEEDFNKQESHFDVLVNVTPLGMSGLFADQLAFEASHIEKSSTVIDAVAFPVETPLIKAASHMGKRIISGAQIISLQAARQFAAYTGVELTDDQIRRASDFSRQSDA